MVGDDDANGANLSWHDIDDIVVPLRDSPPDWMDEERAAQWCESAKPAAEDREPLPLIDPSQWGQEDPPHRRWSIKDYVPHGQATLLTGAGSAGKSLVEQLQCTCVALGLPWLGIDTEQAVSLYISCEDDETEMWRRQRAICDGLGVEMSALKGKLWLLSLVGWLGNELATFDDRGRISVSDRYRDIEAACTSSGAKFVALDNTGHFFSGNENDRHQVASFVGLCNGLAASIDGSVILIGHPNKAGAQYSGSTAWENQVRSRLFMTIPATADGTVLDPDARVISRGKSNYAQKGAELAFRWYKWSFVLPDAVPQAERESVVEIARNSEANDVFIRCLDKATEERRAVSANAAASSFAPRVFSRMTMGKGLSIPTLHAAMERLLHLGEIEAEQPIFKRQNRTWATGMARTEKCTKPCTKPAQSPAQSLHKAALASPHTSALHSTPSTTYVGSPLKGALSTYDEVVEESRAWEAGPPEWMDQIGDPEAWRDNPLLNPDFGRDG